LPKPNNHHENFGATFIAKRSAQRALRVLQPRPRKISVATRFSNIPFTENSGGIPMKKLSVLLIAVASLTSACTWVKVNEQGASVAVANAANVRNCEKISTATVNVKDNFVGSMKRDPNKVATELTNLARNEAAASNGDTIVPVSLVKDGRQSFDVYKCN